MKSQKELYELAIQIAELEKQAQKFSEQGQDKSLKSVLSKIEAIMEELSLEEGFLLNDTVLELLEK